MPLLDPSNFSSQSFWLLVFFAIQYVIIARFVNPSFQKLFATRKEYIEKQIEIADQFTKEAEMLKEEYEKSLEEAKRQNIEKMNLLIEKIKQDSANKLEHLEHELQMEHERSEKRIHNFIENSSEELNEIAIDTAINVISKISGKKPEKAELTKYLN